MDFTADDVKALVDELNAAAKGGDMGHIGFGLGLFVVDEDGDEVPWKGRNGRLGMSDIMAKMGEFYPLHTENEQGDLVACSRGPVSFGVGAGGFILVDIQPQISVAALKEEYAHFNFRLAQILDEVDYQIVLTGAHPSAPRANLEAVPGVPSNSADGMAGLALGIEFADEADAIRKMRIAALLAPVLGFMGENMPSLDCEACATPLTSLALSRAGSAVCKPLEDALFTSSYSFERHAEILLEAGETSLFTGADVALADLLWLNCADAMPLAPAFAFAALVKGLFYSPTTLELLEVMLGLDKPQAAYNAAAIDAAIEAIQASGDAAVVYGRELASWVDMLLRLAPEGLGTEADLLEALQEFKGF